MFTKMHTFLETLPILTRLGSSVPLYLYLLVTDQAMSFVLVQKMDKIELPVYFTRNVFKGVDTKYTKI